jgi:CHASE2 domain-containing sensor protein
MVKIIFLTIDGNLGDGLEMSLQICETNGTLPIVPVPEKGRLKPNPELQEYYEFWLNAFVTLRSHRARGENFDDWEVDNGVTGRSTITGEDACREFVRLTEEKLKAWLLESGDRHWMSIRDTLIEELASHPEDVSIIIQAKDTDLWKLPWYAWDLLEKKSSENVGISFSFPSGQRVSNISPIQPESFTGTGNKVRILVVLGSDRGIDLDPDKQAILNLAEADPHFLYKPTAQELNQNLRDKQGWDIFLFAGHSESDKHKERIYISEHEFVEIADFKHSLREAIGHGLKVAIFNSCQGMGLAERLADLHLPFSIVMQEAVPDRIAQAFLREFLTEYSQGKLLYTAVRIATQRLEDFNQKWPGATWLPIICQNPTELPPSWQDLLKDSPSDDIPDVIPEPDFTDLPEIPEPPARKTSPFAKNWRRRLQTVVVTSLLMTGLTIGVRSQGWLQPFELKAYDHLMRMRPAESPDNRILLITIDQKDVKSQPAEERGAASISDRHLAQLFAKLEKLEHYEPRVIGLHIFRNQFKSENHPILGTLSQQSDRFITICTYDDKEQPGVSPPDGVTQKSLGFTNLMLDPDNILRRHLFFGVEPKAGSDCNTKYSFSYQLAQRYLLFQEGIPIKINQDDEPEAGNVVMKTIRRNSGGYNKINAMGYQLMINYRANQQIAPRFTLTEFLENQISRDLVKDKIVMIGTTAESFNDTDWQSPYSAINFGDVENISGIELQAHLVSQIISAVLDDRPLIWWWPEFVELLWIGWWSLFSGLLLLNIRRPKYLFVSLGGSLGLLYIICWGVMANSAGWIPLIPPALAYIGTGVVVLYLFYVIKN